MTAPFSVEAPAQNQSDLEPRTDGVTRLSTTAVSGSVPLEAILCTEELSQRPTRAPDFETGNRALITLVQALADAPRSVLQTLANILLEMFKAGSAGVSLLTKDERNFFWPAVAGLWHPHVGGGTPRDFGPCGDVLDCNGPLLFKRPERRYLYILPLLPVAEECLLFPFYVNGKAVGTIWVVAHDPYRKFDSEDLRQLESLSRFASAAYQAVQSLEAAQRQGQVALTLVEEAVESGLAMEKLNAEFRASEQRYRTVFDAIEDGFCIIEKLDGQAGAPLDFRYVEVNPAFVRQSGVDSANGVVGKTIRQLFPGITEDWYLTYDTVLKTGEPIRFERELVPEVRVLEVYGVKIEDKTHRRLAIVSKDITQRKQAEDALRQSEAFNRSIIESSPDCIKVLDLEGNLLSMFNGQQLLGIEDIRPFLNKSWIELWKDGDRQAARAAIDAALAGGKGNFVGFFRTFRNEPKWWDVAISPILDAQRKPARLLAVSRDVTGQRRREMNFEFLASVSQDLARWTNVDEMTRTVGASVAAYLQLSLCALVEINEAADQVVINQDWHRDDVPGLASTYRLADFVEEEFIRTARTGEVIVVRDTAADPRTDPAKFAALKMASFVCAPLIVDGQWRFALCLYKSEVHDWQEDEIALTRELTERIWTRLERLRAEATLRRSEELFRALFDRGPIAMYACDASGTLQEFNSVAVNLWGREPTRGDSNERFCGSLKLYLPDGTLVSRADTPMARVLAGEIPFARDVEVVVERPDGSRITVISNVVPLTDAQGEMTGAINCFYDITERSHMELKLQEQAQALTALDSRKNEFLAMLSHELRNPLAPLSNAVHMLRLQTNEDPVQRQARGIIERQVGQLKHLIDDLLEISRITTGRVRLRLERIAISGVVERALETVQPLVTQRRHALTVALPPQPVWLRADAARLEQVVVNLLTNAAKYTDEGGQIWLSVRQEDDAAVLRVRDTGVGIAPELLPRIFDLFTQAERSLDRSQGGLGIGLSLVQHLVELHGGTVEVSSVLGQGSEFVVRLPAVPTSVRKLPADSIATAPPPARSCRVLVVDDNLDAAESMAELLAMHGHEVRMAHDGPAALEAVQQFQADLVLLDIGLPGLTGLEVARRIRQIPALANIMLVAMTGYGQETDHRNSKEAGFDHHLVKPANFDQVNKILATVIPGQRR